MIRGPLALLAAGIALGGTGTVGVVVAQKPAQTDANQAQVRSKQANRTAKRADVKGTNIVRYLRGERGLAGLAGIPGGAGPRGLPGKRGASGATGPSGAAGAAGEATPGTAGERGAQGPQGPPGTDGKDGTNGTDGAQGDPGPQGPQGNQGPPVGSFSFTDASGQTQVCSDPDQDGAYACSVLPPP